LSSDFDANDISLSEMVSLVCHEINNVLNSIGLQAATMEQAAPKKPHSKSATMQRLVREAASLVTRLQAHSRPASFQQEAVDFNDLMRSTRDALQERYPEVSIKLNLAEHCTVQGNSLTLKRILWLLGWHSVSVASAAKPQITITTRLHENRCVLTWHDNGPVVADDSLDRLFDPPFHAVREGSDGVSLPVVRLLVSRLRVSIRALRSPTGGMDFILELPVA
jgi:two-component system, NtrC family, sensor histidine kinase HupT/HoxJ